MPHEKVWDNAKSKTAPLNGTRGAAPTLTSATYKGECANDILDACFGESK